MITSGRPSTSNSISRAVLISGMCSGGNSTSTTGPMIWITRPSVARASPLAASCVIVMSDLSWLGRSQDFLVFAQRFGAADDLHDLAGDLGLALAVRDARVDLDELLARIRRGLHRASPRRVLR